MKIIATAGEILKNGDWDEFCRARGIKPFAMKEGLMESSEEFELTMDEAHSFGLTEVTDVWLDESPLIGSREPSPPVLGRVTYGGSIGYEVWDEDSAEATACALERIAADLRAGVWRASSLGPSDGAQSSLRRKK